MAKFSRCISEPKTLSRLPFFSLGILSKTRQLTAQKSKSSLATSTRILIFLKPHTFFTRIGRFRPNETSESGHRNPTVLKTFSRAVQAPVHTNPDKKKCVVSNISGFLWTGLISSFTSLGSRLFIGDDFRWRNLWEIPHAYRWEKTTTTGLLEVQLGRIWITLRL